MMRRLSVSASSMDWLAPKTAEKVAPVRPTGSAGWEAAYLTCEGKGGGAWGCGWMWGWVCVDVGSGEDMERAWTAQGGNSHTRLTAAHLPHTQLPAAKTGTAHLEHPLLAVRHRRVLKRVLPLHRLHGHLGDVVGGQQLPHLSLDVGKGLLRGGHGRTRG